MKQLQEMMSAIGRKRFIILLVLGVICTILGGVWHQLLVPQHKQLTTEIASIQGERSRLQTEIADLPLRHTALQESEKQYMVLRQRGFFTGQDRIEARARMNLLRDNAGMSGIGYKIEPQEILENTNFVSETDEIVMSKINLEIRSLTDLEALNFIERMQAEFSGLVVLKSFELKRAEEPTQENLQKLSTGEAVDFVTGQASFDWYSIVPKSSTISTPLSQTFEGMAQ